MEKEVFIQIGITALRSPTGEFLPAVPLYIKADKLKQSGLTQEEENILHDISGLFVKPKNKKEDKKCRNLRK